MTQDVVEADHTAVRVALWRALHVRADAPPHVLEDEIGLRLVAPGRRVAGASRHGPVAARAAPGRRSWPAPGSSRTPWSERSGGASTSTSSSAPGSTRSPSAGRRSPRRRLRVFEVDRPGPQAWKRRRLLDLGFGVPDWLRLVPVDFEAAIWWGRLAEAGFDPGRPAVVASTGVTMYLTGEANAATFRLVAGLAPGSTLVTTFLRPPADVEPDQRPQLEAAVRGARAAGTPFLSFFRPAEILALAREAGFPEAEHVPVEELDRRYFAGRTDGVRPSRGEELMVART